MRQNRYTDADAICWKDCREEWKKARRKAGRIVGTVRRIVVSEEYAVPWVKEGGSF